MANLYPINMHLPWSSTEEEDGRFKAILLLVCLSVLLLGLLIPFLSVPEIEREKLEKLPPQLAKILLEKKKQPLPPPKPKAKPKPRKVEKAKPKEKPKPKPKSKPEPKPVELVKQAREKASHSGLMALQDDLAEMRESLDVSAVSSQPLSKGGSKARQTDRSLITSKSTATSGGINTDEMNRNTAGGELASRQTTQVEAPAAAQAAERQSRASRAEGGMPRRSEESIRSVLDQNKGAIYAIYNRALRKDPSLEGKITVKVEIAANGSVVSCKVISSEMNNAKMERKLVSRIKLINFGAQDVAQTVFNYTFDFLPF